MGASQKRRGAQLLKSGVYTQNRFNECNRDVTSNFMIGYVPKDAADSRQLTTEIRPVVQWRVESRTGAVALASRWLLGCFRMARLNPVWLNPVSCSRSSNRTGRFPASGSRKRPRLLGR